MLDKEFIERFLKLNNVPITGADGEIRKALTDARWSQDEVEAALVLLRSPDSAPGIVGVSKGSAGIFRPDFNWSSEQLSALLGVDVIVNPSSLRLSSQKIVKRHPFRNFFRAVSMVIIAVIFAAVVGLLAAYTLEAGPFHSSVEEPLFAMP